MVHIKQLLSLLLVASNLLVAVPRIQARATGGVDSSHENLSATRETASFTSHESQDDEDADEDNATTPTQEGLQFRLSEGVEGVEARPTPSVAPAERLSESATENVLKRLPAMKSDASDEKDFAIRDRSLPPPRTGKVISAVFPAPSQPELTTTPKAAPLEVLRFAPEGSVPLAPQLSITFSQPMVAVTSQTDLALLAVPVELSPQPPGRWRWIGTKTLLFEPVERFPMATRYTATVRAGTKSATGGTLAAGKSWSFATPPPQLKTSHPTAGPHRRDSIIFVEFDQRINPASVLNSIKVRAGATEFRTRLATADEIKADKSVKAYARNAAESRWLALRVVNASGEVLPLPSNTSVTVTVAAGAPSAEGPLTTDKPQSFSFRTYGPLRVTGQECGYDKRCTPDDTWTVIFSNPLDGQVFDKLQIKVTPELAGLKTTVYGDRLQIEGSKKGRTSYKVTLGGDIRDTFGQTLGDTAALTFNVGAADPMLTATGYGFSVSDPAAVSPTFSVYSVNHDRLSVKLFAVKPEDWGAYTQYMRDVNGYGGGSNQKQPTPPGKLVFSKTVAVDTKPDEMVETQISLRPALDGEKFGHAFVVVEPAGVVSKNNRRGREVVRTWVQVTQIGLDAFVDQTDLLGWATSLKDGSPLQGVELSIHPTQTRVVSGADGLARLPLPEPTGNILNLLVARRGQDVAILPEHLNWWNTQGGWHKREIGDALRWYVFDDRKMYRPGEEVHVKGWLRRVGGGKRGDVAALDGTASSVSFTLKDSRGNDVHKGTARLNALGGFDTSFKLPATMNLGYTPLLLQAHDSTLASVESSYTHQIQVQEFRRPEFEVSVKPSEAPHIVGGHAGVEVNAAYYAGGGLANAEVNWRVTSSQGNFTPPNRSDYTFGTWTPWWWGYSRSGVNTKIETFKGRTDASGKHHLRIDFDSVNPPRASTVTTSASVTDVNRQAWSANATLLVHPAEIYVGLRSERNFVQRGERLNVDAIVVDLEGRAVPGREIKMRAALLDWVYEKDVWIQKELSAQECVVKSAGDSVRCSFEAKEGGQYRVRASVFDDRERRNESELTLWVAGGKTPPKRGVEQEKVELIPDRKEFRAGETAEILVQSPFAPAEGVMTLRRSGIVRTERFRMESSSHTLKIPIEEAFTPNVHVQVDLVGASARTDDAGQTDAKLPKRPAYASGTLNLPVPPAARKLDVAATPRDKALEPGGKTIVDVQVRDATGRPVAGSEMAVVVVDEAILALTSYKLPDPLSIFYAQRSADTTDHHMRASVMLKEPGSLSEEVSVAADDVVQVDKRPARRGGGGAGGGGVLAGQAAEVPVNGRNFAMLMSSPSRARKEGATSESDPRSEAIGLRENFNALAVFAASVPTDADGRAQIPVQLPDNLTRYRVMAVSVAGGKQFGSGESSITARMPLMVRPSAPRFLNFGDRFEFPVVVQNQTDKTVSVDVAVRASNAELTEGAGRRVSVAANDRVEVRFPASAVRAGRARFQVGAATKESADAAEIELPVWTPATTEAFATYGEIDATTGSIVQPVAAPSNVIRQFGGLEITTSSTQLQALTDAVLYLVAYPYECSEQLSSRVLAVAALRDVLSAFEAKGLPKPEEMVAAVNRDVKRLQGMQNDDGGFGFWRRGEESWPYVSIHVAHALQRAKEKKFDVPDDMLDKSKKYLRNVERHIPAYYSREARHALIAYALNVRHRMGDRDAARARRLLVEGGLENLSLEAVGWLLPVLSKDAASELQVAAIRKHLNNRVSETAAAAHFTTSYTDGAHLLLHSERRADGVILEALIGDQPQSDLIPKIVRGLLAHRKEGRWGNTQENVFILLALDRYFATYEKVTPDFVSRAWLGERFAGGHEFRGRTTERQHVDVPMRYLAEGTGKQNLVLSKEGAGRLYYRVGMQYAPASLKLDAADYGFTVERVYEAVDDAADVRREADGTWHIKAGARVRVRLTMAAPARRYHVALVDPMPAGLEALNPTLAVTESVPVDKSEAASASPGRGNWWWWRRTWFEHQNFRDERAEAFTSLLWEGVHTYSYVARATTPGLFVVPPPKAEEMYHPETFGRGSTDRVKID